MAEILIATQSFACEIEGESFHVHANVTRVAADHPLVAANPGYFRADDRVDFGVEDASASPGAKRGAGAGRKPKAS